MSVLGLRQLVGKQRRRYNHRTVTAGFRHISLQLLGKVVIAFAGDNGQYIGIEHMVAQYIGILTFALIVDA